MGSELLEQLVRETVELRARVASLERVEERAGMRVINKGYAAASETTLTTTYQTIITVNITNVPADAYLYLNGSLQWECTAYTGNTYVGMVLDTDGTYRSEIIGRNNAQWNFDSNPGGWLGTITAGNHTVKMLARKWNDINTIYARGRSWLVWLLMK